MSILLSEVFANNNAKVVFGAVDTLAKGSTVYVNRRGVTGRDARLDWALGMMNDGHTIAENTTNLIGDGSNSDAKTVVVGTRQANAKLHDKHCSLWKKYRRFYLEAWCNEG